MPVKKTAITTVLFLFILLLSLQLLLSNPARADHLSAPVHHISMGFDLEKNFYSANSRIELPAGVGLQVNLSGLNVSRIMVNGQPLGITPESNYLDIHESSSEQEILITYNNENQPDSASYNMISNTGITLSGQWHPVADREMIFKLTVEIPEHLEAVSEADEIITFQVDNKKQVTFRFPHPLHSIHFVAGSYSITREEFGDGKELIAYFFPEDQELAAEYLDKARQYLERYENLLGPYPFKRFSIVENRLPTGFAMPTFTLLGQSVVRLPFIVDTSLGHEILHSWFGSGVRMSPQKGNWVEGLTTYLADQAFAADKGQEVTYRKEQILKYQSYVRPDMDLTLRHFSNVGHGSNEGRPARAVGYNKSSMFFHMLKNRIGPEVFIDSLRDFYNRLKHDIADWSDLQTSFESISGIKLDDFFAQWLDRNDVPEFSIQEIEVDNVDGYPVLRFDIVQKNDTPYALEIPLIIKTSTEEIHKNVSLTESSHAFEIPLTSVPETLIVDPEYDLMRTLAPSELPATWSRFLGAANKLAILQSDEHRSLYSAMIAELEENDVRILLQDEATDKDLAENSVLFLGAESRMSRALFALPGHPAEGFTLDSKKNPLNTDQVAVLISASDADQVDKTVAKLRHYGKYSYLSFKDGRIQKKHITATDLGMHIELVSLPTGIEVNKSRTFEEIIAKLLNYQVVYIGEGHTNYEDHILQLEIIRALYKHDPNLTIGMEMFTRSTQPILDSYIKGEIDEKTFLKDSHYFKIWRFDYRLYRDIINFAKHNHLPLIALNIEKEIVNKVFKSGGPNSLSGEAMDSLPENRKLDIPGYSKRIATAFNMHAGQEQNGSFSGFLQAQAIWDETMAATITDYLDSHPDARMVIIAGRGHVDKVNAIPPRVARRLPVSQAVVINSLVLNTESETADYIFFSQPASLSPSPLIKKVCWLHPPTQMGRQKRPGSKKKILSWL